MAKQRSGLGRGLDILLSGAGSTGQFPRVEEEKKTEPVVEEKNASAAESLAAQAEASGAEEAPAAGERAESAENEARPVFDEDDQVVIKEVVEREAHAADGAGPYDAEVDITRVHPNPNQPRTNFKKEELEELAESIKRNGLLQPILVRRVEGGDFQIIAGERRWQACGLLGLTKVPVRIKDADDYDAIALALVENIQRSDLNPIEEAYGYKRMMERGGMTQAEVAQAVSKGRSTVANALRLLELPEDAQQLLFEEKITAGHARAILSIPDKEGRKKLTNKLLEKNLSVRETENIARLLSGKHDVKETSKEPAPKSYKTVARTLSDKLSAPVKVKSSGGKNRIEIEFKDEADLERLFRAIISEK